MSRLPILTPALAVAGLLASALALSAAETAKPAAATPPRAASRLPCPDAGVAQYTAYRATGPIVIDGKLDEPAWRALPTSPRFVDLISGGPALHDTRAMVTWDERNLYVGFRLEEPKLKAKFRNHNDPIYYDNDVEVFIAGRDGYYEFELNGYNTVYEVFFIWQEAYERGGFAAAPEFSRSQLQPFNGVGFTTHPRGPRLGHFNWRYPGLQTAVSLEGTVNDDSDTDRGWTVEIAFPWAGLAWLAKAEGKALPPREGDEWRMDFSRFNTYKAPAPATDSGGWTWSAHHIWDSHIPECFARIQFSTNRPPPIPAVTSPPAGTPVKP
jgi:hypothetical protein